MRKKVIVAILAAQMVLMTCPANYAFASSTDNDTTVIETRTLYNEDGLSYDENGFAWDGTTIIGYNGQSRDIVIPEGTNKIGERAFAETDITSVRFPSTLTTIMDSAFEGCELLKEVTLPESLTTIEDWAFTGCSSITSIVIPNKVELIGYQAFSNCSSISNFEIQSEVLHSAGDGIFLGCTSLKKINITGKLTEIPNNMFDGAEYLENVNIPSTVKDIGEDAFNDCIALKEIILPDGLKSIGRWAFAGCINVTSLTIPEKVESIGYRAFAGCYSISDCEIKSNVLRSTQEEIFLDCESLKKIDITGELATLPAQIFNGADYLENVSIPSSVSIIGDGAFCDCESLKEISLPQSLTYIGNSAFQGCKALKEIKLPDNLKNIGNWAFGNCTGLTSVVIPKNVEKIGYQSFIGCLSISEFEIKSDVLNETDSQIFARCDRLKNISITGEITDIPSKMFEDASYLEGVDIPLTVESIGDSAFSGCSSLNEINLPQNLTSIGRWAFMGCSNITSVSIPKDVQEIKYAAYSDCPNLRKVIVNSPTVTFDDDVFLYDTLLTIVCYKNSTAEAYALKNGINCDTSLGVYHGENPKVDVEFEGVSLTLSDQIGVNFYVTLSDEDLKNTDAYMQLKLSDGIEKKVKLSEAEDYDGEENTKVFTYNFAAAQMSDVITAQMVIPDSDGTSRISDEITYSVKQYCQYILNNPGDYSSEMITFVKKLLNYGAYSQKYFDYNCDKLANDILSEKDKALTKKEELLSEDSSFVVNTVEGIEYYGTSLVLRSNTAMRFYFKVEDDKNISDFEFKYNNEVLTPIKSGEIYYVDIDGITPALYNNSYTVTVSGKDFVSSSVNDYCRSIVKADLKTDKSEQLKNLAVAMYELGTLEY